MELIPPRPKKCRLQLNLPLPIILKRDNSISKIKGVFNGVSVVIENRDDMINIISNGYFGKANLSRSYPQFTGVNKVDIIRQRQYNRRKDWGDNLPTKESKQVIVITDSDDDQDFTNLKPEYKIDQSGMRETVWLSPEEAFFLTEVIKCLDIYCNNQIISTEECWNLFSKSNKYFQINYVAYCYFRAKNWVVKPGIKFGGDYLLYQQGPPFYHASYLVVIDTLDHNFERIASLSRRCLNNLSLHGLNRLCETAGKELLHLKIILPEGTEASNFSYTDVGTICVKETLMRRWILNQENN